MRIVKPYGRSGTEFGGKDELARKFRRSENSPRLHDSCSVKKSRGRIQAFRQMLGLGPSLKVEIAISSCLARLTVNKRLPLVFRQITEPRAFRISPRARIG